MTISQRSFLYNEPYCDLKQVDGPIFFVLEHIIQCIALRLKASKNVDFMTDHIETMDRMVIISK